MDKKYRIELFAFYDHNGIAAHLERMAAKGWLLEEMGGLFWTYRKIEPRKLHFAVTYYPEASVLRGRTEKELLLQDYGEAAGWFHKCGNQFDAARGCGLVCGGTDGLLRLVRQS